MEKDKSNPWFFMMNTKPRDKDDLNNISEVRTYNLSDETKNNPSDRFLFCECNSINPLAILNAPEERLVCAVKNPREIIRNQTVEVGIVEFIRSIKNNFEIKYVKYLSNDEYRKMIIRFVPKENNHGNQAALL